jgi:hypothetical protein
MLTEAIRILAALTLNGLALHACMLKKVSAGKNKSQFRF